MVGLQLWMLMVSANLKNNLEEPVKIKHFYIQLLFCWNDNIPGEIIQKIFEAYLDYLLIYHHLHTSQNCFCRRLFFKNTLMNLLQWNSRVSYFSMLMYADSIYWYEL